MATSQHKNIIPKCITALLVVIIPMSITACNGVNTLFATQTPTPSLTFTPIPTDTPIPTITPTATKSPTPTRTATSTRKPTQTSTPKPTTDPSWIFFENEWLTLYYPPDWTIQEPRYDACGISTDCIIRLGHVTSENIEIELIRFPPGIPSYRNVKEADQRYWNIISLGAILIGAPDRLKLLSHKDIVIDGYAAVQRLYEYPLVDPSTHQLTGIQYTYQVWIMQGKDLYDFHMITDHEGKFEVYKEMADKLIYTIVFRK